MKTDLYIDEGVSGTSTKKRIGFNEMIEKAKSGEYDLIVTREVCRFMRNAMLTLVLVN
ncbi:recombinase family protein [Anaerocolumna jejuensis]|nr:recombinase family protein [Anaerocolumna jejuensis]